MQRARGLKDILKEEAVVEKPSKRELKEGESIEQIDLSLISPNPYQPRRIFDQEKLDELANSIREHGVFQPIILKKANGGYLIVAGERRYRAANKAGLKTIPAIVREYEDSQVTELSLIENLQREDLTPIEEAEAYHMLRRNLGLTHNELALKVSKSRSHITNMLGLLSLPEDVQEMVNTNVLSMSHARVLSKMDDPKRVIELAKLIVEKSLSVRDIENLAKEETKVVKQKREPKPNQYVSYEKQLNKKLGYPVSIKPKKLTISYKNEQELGNLLEKLLKWNMKLEWLLKQKNLMFAKTTFGL